MPSIYQCRFLGDSWSAWEKQMVLDELPEDFATDGVSVLLTFRGGTHICYLYHPELDQLTWAVWDKHGWKPWAQPLSIPAPVNFSLEQEDTYFSVVSHQDLDWLVSVNLSIGSVYGCPIEAGNSEESWVGPSWIEASPNWEDSTDVFVVNEDDTEWVVAINLEDRSVFFSEWDGEEYSAWEQVPALPFADNWLEIGIDLDGAIVDGQLQLYAIVYDENPSGHGLGS